MAANPVPTIDIAPFLAGDPEGKRAVAAAVGEACERIGFFGVVDHGVPDELFWSAYDVARRFFDLPLSDKDLVKRPAPEESRGFNAVGREALSYSLNVAAPSDLKETFAIGPVDPPDDPSYVGPRSYPHFAPNVWPARPPELREIWTRYFRRMRVLSDDIMRSFAIALDLPEHFFADKTDKCISLLRSQNYPEQRVAPEPGQLRAGAHSDYGALTIVRGDDAPGGLQVMSRDRQWVDVVFPPGGYVVNIGDLMAQWTNDRWISTLHRVVNPPLAAGTPTRRTSVAFFHQPNYDALIACLPSCTGPGNPPRHEPMTSGDHKRMKFARANKVQIGAAPSQAATA